jgi:hypothetical protein
MRISPNGKKRISTAQKMDLDSLSSRPSIEQQDFSFGDSQPFSSDYSPISKLQSDLSGEKATSKPAFDKDQFAKMQRKQPKDNQGSSSKSLGMRKAYFDDFLPNKCNLTIRITDEDKRSKLFNSKGTVGGNITGFFMVPLEVNGDEIGEEQAAEFADQFAKQHGVNEPLSWEIIGKNMKFTFNITKGNQTAETGSSLDEVLGTKAKKAAETKNSIIKESRNQIINSLVKKGFGGK